MTSIEIEYQYTPGFARRTTWTFLRRYGRKAFVLAGAVFVIGVARVLMHLTDPLTIVLLLMPLLIPVSWVILIRRAIRLAGRLNDPRIVVTLDEQGIAFETTERRSFTSWASLREVWKLSGIWLVFPYGADVGSYAAIPTEAMTADATAFMSRKLQEHATPVRA